ncbi:hypothetical protein Tco_1309511 [Tanacetum coccineum]
MGMGLRNEDGMVNTIFEILRPVAIPRTEPVGDKDGDVKRFPDRDGDEVKKQGWDSKYDLRNSPPVAIPRYTVHKSPPNITVQLMYPGRIIVSS